MQKRQLKLKNNDNVAHAAAEVMPQFPGGDAELMKFIMKNVKYPEEAVKNNIQGRVIVRFVISKTGAVKDAKVLRSVPGLDEAALEVISKLPAFIPGKVNDKPVDCYYTLPVSFMLSIDDSEKAE